MTKLVRLALAAGVALAATGAFAQPPAPPPPPRPGVTWHGPAMHGPAMPGPRMQRPMMQHPMGHGRMNFPRRLHRGGIVPPFFFSPQYVIGNWQLYGFAAPGPGQRWIRYYDDAYLLDGDGRIVDEREGLDWDSYGEHWAMDGDAPYYDGRGDERVRTYVYGAPGYPPPQGYYGYGGYGAYGGYGYGYGYGAPIIVETTVTGGGGYTEEVTEELVRVRTPHRRVVHRAPRCICQAPAPRVVRPRPRPHPAPRRPAPRPPAGERG